MKKVIELRKLGTTGEECFWKAEIDGAKVTYSYGRVEGKVQSETITYTEGKNVGRANETSPEAQCLLEVMTKAKKKLDKEYTLFSGSLTAEATASINTSYAVPLPMLAKSYQGNEKKVTGIIYLQEKLDGNRCLVNRFTGKMYSRTRKEIAHIPAIGAAVVTATAALPASIEWIDGELFATGMSFNDLQTILRREKNVDPETIKLMNYHIFDVISPEPWEVRRNIVASIKASPSIHVVKDVKCPAAELKVRHDAYVSTGFEGAIIRLSGVGYENKRSSSLIKYKVFHDAEYKIVGWNCEKHDSSLLGSATLVMKDGTTFEARPAMSDSDKAELWKNRAKYIGEMATIKYQELDVKSGIPRFPVMKSIRTKNNM